MASSTDSTKALRSRAPGARATHFSAFAPPEVVPAKAFLVEVCAFEREYGDEVTQNASQRGKGQVSAPKQRPISIMQGARVSIELDLQDTPFTTEQPIEYLDWDGTYATAVFKVKCITGADAGHHVCQAMISVIGQSQQISLTFELTVSSRGTDDSPPASVLSTPPPLDELVEVETTTTQLPELQPGGEHHIFINYRRTITSLLIVCAYGLRNTAIGASSTLTLIVASVLVTSSPN